MGQIKVEKNVGGIEGLCVIEPAVHGDAELKSLLPADEYSEARASTVAGIT